MKLHGSEEAISAARERFHKTGILCGVAQCIAQALHGGVQAVVEINKGIRRPQAGVKILPCNHFSGALQKRGQHLKGLFLEASLEPVAAELPGTKVYLKDSKADNSVCGVSWHFGRPCRAP